MVILLINCSYKSKNLMTDLTTFPQQRLLSTFSSNTTPKPKVAKSFKTDVPVPHSYVKYGNTVEESTYLVIWEDKCLKDVFYDIKIDKDGTNGDIQVENLPLNYNDVFAGIEQKAAEQMKLFDKIDLVPFLEANKNKTSITTLDYNFKPFLIFMIVILTFLLIGLIIMCIFTCFKSHQNKLLKRRPCCTRICLALTTIGVFIMTVVLILNFTWVNRIANLEKDFLCEATRVPHSLFFGNPELHYNVQGSKHFVGFERLRSFIDQFIKEYDSFLEDKPHQKHIEEIVSYELNDKVKTFENSIDSFYEAYKDKTSLNSSETQEKPYSISYSLPIYISKMKMLLNKYNLVVSRLDGIKNINKIFMDSTKSKEFKSQLKTAGSELFNVQILLSDFWNSLMKTSLQSTIIFKVIIICLVISEVLIVIGMWIVYWVFILSKNTEKMRMTNKKRLRYGMIIIFVLIIIVCIEVMQMSRVLYTSIYGCVIMKKLQEDPEKTKVLIQPYLFEDKTIETIFNRCYFEKTNDPVNGFYQILPNIKSREALDQYLVFLDGLKLTHEDIKLIDRNLDKSSTQTFINEMTAYKDGITKDFGDVSKNLLMLNNNYECSPYHFALNTKSCEEMPSHKSICINIFTDSLKVHECVTPTVQNTALFNKLQKYIKAENELMDELIAGLSQTSDNNTILNSMSAIFDNYELIDNRIKIIEDSLNTHLSTLADGSIETWMDCRVIKEEVTKSYNRLCFHHLFDLVKFLDINSIILLLAAICIPAMFFMTFCFTDGIIDIDYKEPQHTELPDMNEYTKEISNVFDDQSQGSILQLASKKTGDGNVRTFTENQNQIPKTNKVKFDEDLAGQNLNNQYIDEVDSFDAVNEINNDSINEYKIDYKK